MVNSLGEEKQKIAEKLFNMQQNFIRKLDQQIEKTEEDKNVQDKCREDNEEGADAGGYGFQRPKNSECRAC